MISWSDLFWIFLLVVMIWPAWQRRLLLGRRLQVLRRLEEQRGSRVILLVHRQESVGILGIPVYRYIDVDDSEDVLRAIRLTPPDMPIDLVLHTPGGLVLAAEQIADALVRHRAQVTVFVPHYAMSGGTLIALAADRIVMDRNAVLGPVDPQLGEYPAASILAAVQRKGATAQDRTLILADIAGKAQAQVRTLVIRLLSLHMEADRARTVAAALTDGRWTHDYPIGYEDLVGMGLPASDDLPDDVHRLMDLFPQTFQRRPSVMYVPMPYGQPRSDGRE